MCTVTWWQEQGSWELFCNRDEQRSHLPARPPRLSGRAGARFLAPVDGDAGGTWIAGNEHGLGLCLLNDYESEPRSLALSRISRGLLVRDLAALDSLAAVLSHLGIEISRPTVLFGPCSWHRTRRRSCFTGMGSPETSPRRQIPCSPPLPEIPGKRCTISSAVAP